MIDINAEAVYNRLGEISSFNLTMIDINVLMPFDTKKLMQSFNLTMIDINFMEIVGNVYAYNVLILL